MATSAPPAYASPKTGQQIERSRYLADAIRNINGASKDVFNTAEGTNYNVLANAILGYKANQAENRAERMLGADKTRIADMIRGQFQDPSVSAGPMDLTPGAVQQTSQTLGANKDNAKIGDLASMIFETTGDPTAALNAGMNQKRQAIEDQRYNNERDYSRTRDARADFVDDRGFGFQKDRAGVADNQWGQQFDFTKGRAGVADQQWGAEFGESKRQFDARMAAEAAQAAQAAELKRQEITAKRDGSAMFEGPQLASVYNKSMDFVDDARNKQGVYDTIASNAQQFVDTAKDKGFWAQGEGFLNDAAQALSMDTTTLKSLTDRIAPLMREAGSGASSDKDVDMFKSAVVSINNTPEANQRFAQGAAALAKRNNEYVQFLNEAISPQDPQSRQKAQRIWDMYKNDQRLFDDATGAVNPAAQSFGDWFAENSGGGGAQSDAPVRISSPEERDALPPGTQYLAPDGSVKVKR